MLYSLVREHLETFLAHARESYGAPLPRYVEDEFREYLRCGVFAHGFVRARCESCDHDLLVAFSCKRRGLCPSCAGRRMSNEAAALVDRVLPAVPVRQWVLSLPFELRALAAFGAKALTALSRIFADAVGQWYRRWAERSGFGCGDAARPGAVTFVQRFGSSLNLNVHFHTCFLDGVYSRDVTGQLAFHGAPSPNRDDVEGVVRIVHRRALRWLARHGHLERAALEERSNESVRASPIEACAEIATQRGTMRTLGMDAESSQGAKEAAGVDMDAPARQHHVDVSAERGGSASFDVAQRPTLLRRQRATLQEPWTVDAHDVRQLDGRTRARRRTRGVHRPSAVRASFGAAERVERARERLHARGAHVQIEGRAWSLVIEGPRLGGVRELPRRRAVRQCDVVLSSWRAPAEQPRRPLRLEGSEQQPHPQLDRDSRRGGDHEMGAIRGTMGGLGAIVSDVASTPASRIAIDKIGQAGLAGSSLAAADPANPGGLPLACAIDDWSHVTAFFKSIRSPRAPSNLDAAKVAAGRALFQEGNCQGCHGGSKWTTSRVFYTPDPPNTVNNALKAKSWSDAVTNASFPTSLLPAGTAKNMRYSGAVGGDFDQIVCALRPVDTYGKAEPEVGVAELRRDMVTAAQGNEADGKGYNVPSLLSMTVGAPYLHAGQARTLEALFESPFATHREAPKSGFSAPGAPNRAENVAALVAFLLSIDESTETIAEPALGASGGSFCAQ